MSLKDLNEKHTARYCCRTKRLLRIVCLRQTIKKAHGDASYFGNIIASPTDVLLDGQ